MQGYEIYRKPVWSVTSIVASYYGLKVVDLYGFNRHRPFVPARQIVWKIIKDAYGSDIPLVDIGLFFGRRTHATILQGIRSISNQIDTDRALYSDYKKLSALARVKLGLEKHDPRLELAKRLRGVIGCSNMVHARVAIREILSTLVN